LKVGLRQLRRLGAAPPAWALCADREKRPCPIDPARLARDPDPASSSPPAALILEPTPLSDTDQGDEGGNDKPDDPKPAKNETCNQENHGTLDLRAA
jgi:hypothetical protein